MPDKPRLKFDVLFPDAEPFCEPTPTVFKNIQSGRCFGCSERCTWLGYWSELPTPVCSIECFEQLDALANYAEEDESIL
jgi:hypothetical protein